MPLLALSLLHATGLAQHDPTLRPVPIQVLSAAEGLPMPGVVVYHVPFNLPNSDGLFEGWLREDHPLLRQLLHARSSRSDPDGIATLLLPDGQPGLGRMFVGAPFQSPGPERDGDAMRLRVTRLQQFVVRAVDANGAALGSFALAMQDGTQVVAVARTDARGHAVFGVAPHIESRLRIVPFGWIGPTDAFPTVAQQLPGKFANLVVPQHGFVRLRALVQGKVAPAAIASASLREPAMAELVRGGDTAQPRCHGVLFGPVALGVPLQGALRIGRLDVPFAAPALTQPSEERVVDVETDPPRPKFALRCVGAATNPRWGQARLIVWTDAGAFVTDGSLDGTGHLIAAFDGHPLRGERVLRIDCDATLADADGTMLHATGSHTQPFALQQALHELGDLAMARLDPVVHGRIVDAAGQPVPGAIANVAADPGSGFPFGLGVTCDADGYFTVLGTAFRGGDGELLPLTVTPSLPGARERRGEAVAVLQRGSRVELRLPAPDTGTLTISLREPQQLSPHQLRFTFVDAAGTARELAPNRLHYGGKRGETVQLLGMRLGRGSLRIRLRSGGELARIDDVVVADPEVTDARLRDLDLHTRVRNVTLRIVDDAGVPLHGARVRAVLGSERIDLGNTDAAGRVLLQFGRDEEPLLEVSADGRQRREFTTVQDGMQVALGAAEVVRVAVTGLPADLPRARIDVMFRSVVRDNLADTVWAKLGADDVAQGPLPVRGTYLLRLVVRRDGEHGGSTWSQVGQRDGEAVFDGTAPRAPLEFAVDAATVARVREELAR